MIWNRRVGYLLTHLGEKESHVECATRSLVLQRSWSGQLLSLPTYMHTYSILAHEQVFYCITRYLVVALHIL